METLRRDVFPFDGPILFIEQSGRMIVPMNFVERRMAIDTFFPCVPLVHYRANEARFRSFFDLRKTLLPTTLAFRPAGALTQGQMRRAGRRLHGSFCG